jgi:hypothetical protein
MVAAADHVIDGQADDTAERLCVEQDDGGRDPGPERQVVAGQQAAEQARAFGLAGAMSLGGSPRRAAGNAW